MNEGVVAPTILDRARCGRPWCIYSPIRDHRGGSSWPAVAL